MDDADILRRAFDRAVYFHAVGGPLTHNSGCLIEGCLELGIPVQVSTTEVTSRPISMPLQGVDLKPFVSQPYAGFAGYILDVTHTGAFISFDGIVNGRIAYLTQSDTSIFSRIPDGQLLFVTHVSRFASKGGMRSPIAFGLSNDLIRATENRKPFKQRTKRALRNFRASMNQSLRALLDISYVPLLERHMPIDRTIYDTGPYLEALRDSQLSLAYGGELYSPLMENPWFAEHQKAQYELHRFEHLDAPAIVIRWDSWRLWESFVGGCLTVHLDFAKYGFVLPVMPEPWVHYVPIDLDDIAGSVTQLLDRQAEWEGIAEAGRAWAIEHYAPKATTMRVLNEMLTRAKVITRAP